MHQCIPTRFSVQPVGLLPDCRPAVKHQISTLLLDALGTLLELEPPAPALQAVLAERFSLEIAIDSVERAMGQEIAYYRAHLQEGRDPESLADLRARCAEVVRGALGPAPGLDAISPAEMTDALLAALRFEAFPDAAPALEDARARGLRLVVVSNWDASLPDVLARVGLAPLLDGVFSSAQVGARKPDPAIFRAALAGEDPARALHVGDSLVEDIEGAQRAGVRSVLIRRDGEPGPPNVRTIATLAEFGPLLSSEC
jgi:putative hydrolase of the HAD superfamily